jgi:hypothetical protein
MRHMSRIPNRPVMEPLFSKPDNQCSVKADKTL